MNKLTIRGICPVCKRRRRVRRDGMIRVHYVSDWPDRNGDYGGICKGSEQKPLDYSNEHNWFCNVDCSGCDDMIKYGV